MTLHRIVSAVATRIIERGAVSRPGDLERIAHSLGLSRKALRCKNFAHGIAAVPDGPMPSGLSDTAKRETRRRHAEGRLGDGDLDPLVLAGRVPAQPPVPVRGTGRELFSVFRDAVGPADRGASVFGVA